MKVISKKTNNVFVYGKTYDAEMVGLQYKFTIDGDHVYYGSHNEYYTIEEWRDIQINKIFKNG